MRIRRSSIRNVPFLWLAVEWELDQKKRARAWMIFKHNISLMFLNNTIGNGETQASARANFFSGKKRVENALFNLSWNTRAAILDADVNHLSLRGTGDSNQFFRHISQCVACIG